MVRRPRYVDADRSLFPSAAGDDTVAAFLYSKNVYARSELYEFSGGARVIASSGVVYAPVELFEKYLSATRVEKIEKIRLDGHEYSYAGKTKEKDGILYIPATEALSALGLSSKLYLGKLLIIGNEELLDSLSKDDDLLDSALYTLAGVYSTDELTSEDFTKIKDKWRRILVGDKDINDLTDPDVKKKVDDTAALARKLQASRNTAPDRPILWGDAPPTDSSDVTWSYDKILNMALGWGTYGAECYRDEKLKDDIIDSFEWMYENMYGVAETEGRGWRDPHDFNWWDWFCGGALRMLKAMIIMEEYLTMDMKERYVTCLKYTMTIHRLGYRIDYAASRLTVGTPMALLLEDRELLYTEFLDYDLLLEDAYPVRGKYTDMCCWEHKYPYNMMYGFCALNRTFFTASLLLGTAAQFKSPKEYEMYELVKYMFEAACYKGQGYMIYNGRGNMGTEFTSGVAIATYSLPMIGYFGEDEDLHLKKMVKRFCSTPVITAMMKKACSLYELSKLNDILNDPSIPSESDYELTYAWFTADRITQQKKNYAFMLAMSNERHPSYESINSANKRGWFTGDGALYFYTDTDRNSFDGANFITNPEITKRIPGTTTDAREMKEWSYRHGWYSPCEFAGCMDLYSSFGIGAFDYSAYHYDGHEADNGDDSGYGGDHVYYENDLVAKKAYFFFDEEVLCLGAGINSTMNSPVRTTVEHRRLVKCGGEDITVGTKPMPKDEFTDVSETKSVYIEGFAGYVFPEGEKVETRRYVRRNTVNKDHYYETVTGEGEEQYCAEINILHGENPKDQDYSYVILPYATPDEINTYEAAPRVEILENSTVCQAARKPAVGVTSIAFYEPGERFGITSDIPAIVMMGEREGILTVSVCDPTQKKEQGTFTVKGDFEIVCASPELSVKIGDGCAVLFGDFRELAGKNLVAELRIK